jgi:hypothetical protein
MDLISPSRPAYPPHEEEPIMPTTSPTPADTSSPVLDDPPPTTAQKTAATVRRRKEERREESLRQIRAQTADGTLVIRQMTVEQQDAASALAGRTRERNDARTRRYRG